MPLHLHVGDALDENSWGALAFARVVVDIQEGEAVAFEVQIVRGPGAHGNDKIRQAEFSPVDLSQRVAHACGAKAESIQLVGHSFGGKVNGI